MDGATIYTWTTGGASYAEGSFISPFYEAPSSTGPSLSSPADITGTFYNTNYNNGNSSGAITYEGHTASGITDTNKYYYNLKPSVSNETHWIYFDASSNRWYDYGNGDPTCFHVNNAGTPFINPTTVITGSDTIQVRDGGLTSSYGNPIFTFTHPSYLIAPNYNLQSFTYNGLTADENESLTEYQGLWRAWDWTWVEGDGDGVIYTKSDWTLHKNTDGSFYVVKTVDGFTSGNFSPDANGIATITFNWNEHTAIMFKPPA